MRTRLRNLWIKLSASFWFVPALLTLCSLVLSFVMIGVDERVEADFISDLGWIYTNKPEGAREVLSTIAGSMITVAGVVFSITIVALSLASSQFGPRLLRNFMRDRGNQIVLGTFIATYFYCLLVLRTIRSGDETQFVPHLSVLAGVVLAVLSLGVLIYFIHHVAESIQVNHVIRRVSTDLHNSVNSLFPEEIGQPAAQLQTPENLDRSKLAKTPIPALRNGYLQAIDQDGLLAESKNLNGFTEVLLRPGQFALKDQPLAYVYLPGACQAEKLKKLQQNFILGIERTPEQDLLYPFHQLVEIALRALSPSVNDPFTAKACLDRLSAGLCHLAQRREPSPFRTDEKGEVRVLATPVLFPEALAASFNQIRLYARENPELLQYFLERHLSIATCMQLASHKKALLHQAQLLYSAGTAQLTDAAELGRFTETFNAIKKHLHC